MRVVILDQEVKKSLLRMFHSSQDLNDLRGANYPQIGRQQVPEGADKLQGSEVEGTGRSEKQKAWVDHGERGVEWGGNAVTEVGRHQTMLRAMVQLGLYSVCNGKPLECFTQWSDML